jgi:hypothetical protein
MPLLVVEGILFNYGTNFLFYGLEVGKKNSLFALRGKLSLFTPCNSSMLFRHLWQTIKFMIVFLFLVPTSNNLVGPNQRMPFSFLEATQQSKKCNKSRTFVITCFNNVIIEYNML